MSLRSRYVIIALVGAAAAIALASYLNGEKTPQETPRAETTISINGETFPVLLAQTEAERQKGLGGVEDLGPHAGMLFVLEWVEGGGIWMKGMTLSLDILWLSEGGVVLKMEQNIAPSDPRLFMHDPSTRYVLEVPAGFAAQHGIEVGSKVTF